MCPTYALTPTFLEIIFIEPPLDLYSSVMVIARPG